MWRTLRQSWLAIAGAALAVCAMAWLGLYGFAWNDYEVEALPAMQALVHGHFALFARLAPAYGGSLLLRAPFAFIPSLWGGGALAVYRAISIPCLAATAALGLWLRHHQRRSGASRLAASLALALCVANPIFVFALELGHAEVLLGAALCAGAVLLALRGRALWAGLLLGLAIANKETALLAAGPVLLALPRHRLRCALIAAGAAAALLGPIALLSPAFVAATRSAASTPSTIFQPWQIFWFLGAHGHLVHGLFGNPKPGYRTAPAWVGPISHPLIVACAPLLPAALWWRSRERARTGLPATEALLLLCLLMLLRCLLDTWDTSYYTAGFLVSLLAWESHRHRRPPLISLAAAVLAWASFAWLPSIATPDVQSAFFLAWTAPLALALALRLYAPGWWTRRRTAIAQSRIVSSFGSELRFRQPSAVTTTRSSILTPSSPGR